MYISSSSRHKLNHDKYKKFPIKIRSFLDNKKCKQFDNPTQLGIEATQ